MWEIFSSFHSFFLFPFPRKRESPCFCRLWRGIRAAGAGVGRFPLSREWGVVFLLFFLFPSLLPLSVSSPAPAFCFLPCFRFLFSSPLPLSVSSPASAFPPLLPHFLPYSRFPPPFPFPRKRESPVNWGGAGNARTAPIIPCRRVFAVQQRDRPCRIFWRFGRIAAATPTAN